MTLTTLTAKDPSGLVTIHGPGDFVQLGLDALAQVIVPIELLIAGPMSLSYVEQIGPPAPTWAKGYFRSGARRADIRQVRRSDGRPRRALVQYLTLHELLGHGSDLDVLDNKRPAIRKLMSPYPTSWGDDDGRTGMARYWHLPSECYANRLVEALTQGQVRSPYDDDYTRWIPNAALDDLVELVIHKPSQPDPEPTVPALPGPPPVELDAVRALVAQTDQDIRADLDELIRAVDALGAVT